MIKDLMELNDFVVNFCNYVVRQACTERTIDVCKVILYVEKG